MRRWSWAVPFGLLLSGLLLAGLPGREADTLTAGQASEYVGETATVCGVVASAHYASRSRGRPTFLNLDKPYPNHVFTALIWGGNRSKFKQPPEHAYKGNNICVRGKISRYQGKSQIIVTDPSQVRSQQHSTTL